MSSKVEAKPKLPFMNSSLSLGRLTPARLNTKSHSLHHVSSCSGGGIEIVLEDFLDRQVAVATCLAVFDVIELSAKVLADEAFGTSN